jgi:pimeloyl-ACP methyl ester carboxylesterase
VDVSVSVNGGTLWVEDSGGDGRPVLLIHGGWTDSRVWEPLISMLPAGTRTVRYDARGYGRSAPSTEPFTQLGDLKAVLDHRGISSAVVVGHSGGGATALCLALDDPRRVSQLVLLAPGVSDYPWPLDDPYFAEFEALYAAYDQEGLVRLGLQTWAPGDPTSETEALVRDATEVLFIQGDLQRPDPPAFDRLAEIDVAATLVIGASDHHTVLDCAKAIVERLPGCRQSFLAGVDHMVPLRVPAMIADIVTGRAPATDPRL